MAYTELLERGNTNYYYRSHSVRDGKKVKKKRIYMGKNLYGLKLKDAERAADKKLGLPVKDDEE